MPEPEKDVFGQRLAAARSAMDQRSCNTAIPILREASELQPPDPQPGILLGECLFRMARYAEAEAVLRAVHGKDRENFAALSRAWAAHLQDQGRSASSRAQVLDEIHHVLERHSGERAALVAALMGYRYLGRHDAARALFGPILATAGNQESGRQIEPLLFQSVVEMPGGAERIRLARLYLRHFPQANNAYPAGRLLVRETLSAAGDTVSRGHQLDRWLADPFAGPAFRQALAGALIRTDYRLGDAERLLQQNILGHRELTPAQNERKRQSQLPLVDDWYLLGRARERAGRLAGAREAFEEATKLDPAHGRTLLSLARLARKKNDAESAIQLYRRVLELDAGNAGAEEDLQELVASMPVDGGDVRRLADPGGGVPRFTDMTAEQGLSGVRGRRVGWRDYDRDGRPDLLLDLRLYRNSEDGFTDVTGAAGLPTSGRDGFATWGDVDNDGWPDLVLVEPARATLYRNQGHGRFVQVPDAFRDWGSAWPAEAAAWGDMEGDGLIDLYVAGYEEQGVERGICSPDRLYRNIGGGHFEEDTARRGLVLDEPLCGRDVAWVDVDGDDIQEILVGNYRLDPNVVWKRRQGSHRYREWDASAFRGQNHQGAYGHTIGIAIGDLDGNGWPDMFVSNLAHPRYLSVSDLSMLLLRQAEPGLKLHDRFDASGIRFEETSALPVLGDVDNDGDLDLVFSAVYPGRDSHLYINRGDAIFEDRTWLADAAVANGWDTSLVDVDRDGDLDLFVASVDGVRLLRNDARPGHWLEVTVHSRDCNRSGIGSRVQIEYDGHRQVRWIAATRRELPEAHFGLGEYNGPLRVDVRDLCGAATSIVVPAADRRVTVRNTGSPSSFGLGSDF